MSRRAGRKGQFGSLWVDVIIWLVVAGLVLWIMINYIAKPGGSIFGPLLSLGK